MNESFKKFVKSGNVSDYLKYKEELAKEFLSKEKNDAAKHKGNHSSSD